jgi:hypothetical protein
VVSRALRGGQQMERDEPHNEDDLRRINNPRRRKRHRRDPQALAMLTRMYESANTLPPPTASSARREHVFVQRMDMVIASDQPDQQWANGGGGGGWGGTDPYEGARSPSPDMEDNRPDAEIDGGTPPGDETEKQERVLVGLDSMMRIAAEHGDSTSERDCYACSNLSQIHRQPMLAKDFKTIASLFDQVVEQSPEVVADQVKKLYDHMRAEALKVYSEAECPLPEWTLANIIAHAQGRHHLSARLWHATLCKQVDEITFRFATGSLVSYNEKTGQEKMDKEQLTLYLQVAKFALQLRKQNPDDLAYANRGVQVDQHQLGQPMLTRGKNLIDKLTRKRKKGR